MTDHTHPTRRRVLKTAAAVPLLTPTLAAVAKAAGGPGADMVSRAARFINTLDDGQRKAAYRAFGDPLRPVWDYMTGSAVSPGLPLEAMTDAQRDAAMDLLASGLSREGLAKAERVMILQDVLRDEMSKGSADRNSRRFSMILFGNPTGDGPWAWRFEGHHLTLTYTLIGERVVSVTPSSFSSDPNAVPSGPHQGLVALDQEEAMGRTLFGDLEGATRRAALLQEASFGNVLALHGREDRVGGARKGVPLADLTQAQSDLAQRIMDVYGVDHLPGPLADEQRARLREGDVDAIRFGWAGDPGRGSVYYRLQGDTFTLEFATLRRQPQHHHTIRHDFARNMGAHAV